MLRMGWHLGYKRSHKRACNPRPPVGDAATLENASHATHGYERSHRRLCNPRPPVHGHAGVPLPLSAQPSVRSPRRRPPRTSRRRRLQRLRAQSPKRSCCRRVYNPPPPADHGPTPSPPSKSRDCPHRAKLVTGGRRSQRLMFRDRDPAAQAPACDGWSQRSMFGAWVGGRRGWGHDLRQLPLQLARACARPRLFCECFVGVLWVGVGG